jgi:hypothetical protein
MASFRTSLQVELIDPLAHKGQGLWRLLQPLVFEDNYGGVWTVPVDFESDFASVPRLPFVYAWAGNTAHAPSVLHDWAIRAGVTSREYADELFRQAMESIDMPAWRVGLMYRAVSAETRNIAARLNPWKCDDYPR